VESGTDVRGKLAKSRFDGKVVRGKDGWLFLDNDTNAVMSQYAGRLRLSDEQVSLWRILLENRSTWLEKRGVPYFFLVAPNSHCVYPEKLPDGSGTGEGRPVLQILEHLRDESSYAHLIYPLEELIREKSRQRVFTKTQTHWTEAGAYVAYRRLMAEISTSMSLPVITEEDLTVREKLEVGDLGSKVDPPASSLDVYMDIRNQQARLIFDNRVDNTGRCIEYRCDKAPPLRCMVFGDSFTAMLLPFLAESFARLHFAHMPTLDYGLIERERPDVVISVMNERFLISVPDDLTGFTLERLEARKREAGLVYPPRVIPLPGNRIDSPAADVSH
jgi:hypothetical protein